jgi:FMN-dependent NADH-azoreductase
MLFRLDASFRTKGSHSGALADIVEEAWLDANADEQVVRRHLGTDPIPATAWADAVTSGGLADDQRTAEQRAAVALAATLVDELINADPLLFAIPLFNESNVVNRSSGDAHRFSRRRSHDAAYIEDVWGLQLSVVELEFTLVGVNPALDQFKDIAAKLHAEAEARAAQHGAVLGQPAPALT